MYRGTVIIEADLKQLGPAVRKVQCRVVFDNLFPSKGGRAFEFPLRMQVD